MDNQGAEAGAEADRDVTGSVTKSEASSFNPPSSGSAQHTPKYSDGDVEMNDFGDDDTGSSDDDDDGDDADPNKKSKKKRRRGLPGSSCEPCRKQHRACDGNRPCDRCSRNNRGEMCKYGIAPVSTRPRRKSKNASSGSDGVDTPTGQTYVTQPVGLPLSNSHDLAVVSPGIAFATAFPHENMHRQHYADAMIQPVTIISQDSGFQEQQVAEDERDKLHEELQSLAQVLDNLQSQLQPAASAPSQTKTDAPTLDPIFLRDSLWRPPAVPTLYAAAGTKPSRGKIMTLDAKDQTEDSSTSTRGKKRKPVRKFYPRALKGTTVGYSESELANLQFAKDLLAYFGGDFNNVSVGQHAQCVVYKDFIVYVNREFIELMRSPYENIIGRSMDDFVPEAFLQYHNHMFHRELVASGSSTIAFETVMARLDRTCFKCVFGMSLMKNGDGKLVQKICTIYLNTIQEVEVPPGKTPVPYFETEYSRKVEYEELPEPCKKPNGTHDESKFPLYFAKACFEAKQIRESRLTARRNKLPVDQPSQ
eukprot:TRINITY_DN1598_c0_g1_i1.p1 TRINITY_DN1598_c0_g1~~TRINITY_DN1598_c0_g1_i1.p1  ORF type:complete len:542 (+),score=126.88 TRINITY_DN1598_c0_g1_i1:30-1628(+)